MTWLQLRLDTDREQVATLDKLMLTTGAVAVTMEDNADQAVAIILKSLPAATPDARCSLIRVLGQLGGAEALAAVTAATGDADTDVREAAWTSWMATSSMSSTRVCFSDSTATVRSTDRCPLSSTRI